MITYLSLDPDANYFISNEKSIHETASLCAFNFMIYFFDKKSQIIIVLSLEADAIILSSIESLKSEILFS
jgi:hypothetical protein